MRRLFVLIWLALSLAVTSGPAFAMPAPDCPMAASDMPAGHDEMECCKPACAPNCAMVCPGAMMPFAARAGSPSEHVDKQLTIMAVDMLPSIDLAGTDPPPRTTFS